MVFSTMFREGATPSLEAVLTNRERRVRFIQSLLKQFAGSAVVSLKLNIPGPIKNNGIIEGLFEWGKDQVNQMLLRRQWQIFYSKSLNLSTGPEGFWVIGEAALSVKGQLLLFEEGPLGRLFDADVLRLHPEQGLEGISRSALGKEPRKCFLCNEEAKACAGRRIHSVEALQQKIIEIMEENSSLLPPKQGAAKG